MTETSIRNCPFCGSNDVVVFDDGAFGCWVACYSCSAEGPVKDTRDEAIAAWNKRVGQEDQADD